ncbi:MAG: acyl carrier protein [Rhodospirillaceae bacterium]|nr:acyl carrier protein [Rhodospirillaceae bacterium]
MSDVLKKVREFIAKEGSLPLERVQPDSSLKDLQLESLDAVQIIFAIEEHFQISLPYENIDLEGQTVADLVATVERLLGERQAPAT